MNLLLELPQVSIARRHGCPCLHELLFELRDLFLQFRAFGVGARGELPELVGRGIRSSGRNALEVLRSANS